jgi:hypothetical protein
MTIPAKINYDNYVNFALLAAFPFGRKFPSRRKFGPLEGNLEGNSIWKEIGRKYCNKEGNEKEIYFIS